MKKSLLFIQLELIYLALCHLHLSIFKKCEWHQCDHTAGVYLVIDDNNCIPNSQAKTSKLIFLSRLISWLWNNYRSDETLSADHLIVVKIWFQHLIMFRYLSFLVWKKWSHLKFLIKSWHSRSFWKGTLNWNGRRKNTYDVWNVIEVILCIKEGLFQMYVCC